MPRHLHIADSLSLPLDFVTERIAFLARTGAGKSGGMRVLFEEFLEAKQFVVFLDPKGDAWGIRAAGIGPGYPVLVMGGDHGDVPLEASAGKVVAEFLVKERVSTVLDVSDFGKAGMIKFVTDLATTLYRRNRDVLQFMLDEADMVAGEKFYDPHCLEAIQLIQNKGRHRGFGVTVASQRSAMINKTVLYASGTLVAMQTTSPKDIKTIRDWLEVVATAEAAKEIVSALPTLRTREALVYSPQYLPEPTRITFKTFRTFDSMRTPRPGETRQQPKSLADIDLSAVQQDMAATIEKFKAEDPKELRKKIAELTRQVNAKTPAPAIMKPVETIKTVEVSVLKDGQLARAEKLLSSLETVAGEIRSALAKVSMNGHKPIAPARRPSRAALVPQTVRAAIQRKVAPVDDDELSGPERRILDAIAWLDSLGIQEAEQTAVAFLAGYTYGGGGFNNPKGRLNTRGFVTYISGNKIALTDEGRARAQLPGTVLTAEELQRKVLERLPGPERKILQVLIDHYPNAVTNEDCAAESGYTAGGGGFNNPKGRLRSLGLIDYPERNYAVAKPLLFLE